MEKFIRRENVKHYEHLLETETDEAKRQQIRQLLEEERRKQRERGDADASH
jgi:hypothetical protein